MTNKYEHLLPPEFKSGNDIPVPQAVIKRERMLEIIEELNERTVINDEIALMEHLRIAMNNHYPQLNSVIGREMLLIRCFHEAIQSHEASVCNTN